MTPTGLLLVSVAAFAAGLINSVAGGGTFLSFPALVYAGVPVVVANATNTVALFPGQLASAWVYRHDFPKVDGLRPWPLVCVSLAGGACGAVLLVRTPAHAFGTLVPWLLLFATTVFAFSRRLVPWLKARFTVGPVLLYSVQWLLGVYGGYFGGAVGILMLALFGLFGLDDIHSANALKTLLSGLVNAIAVVCFVYTGAVAWQPAALMVVAAIAGGHLGARMAKQLPPLRVRQTVIAIGAAMSVTFFVHHP